MKNRELIFRYTFLLLVMVFSACAEIPCPTARVVFPAFEEELEGIEVLVLRAKDGPDEKEQREEVECRASSISENLKAAVNSLGQTMGNSRVSSERFIVLKPNGNKRIDIRVEWAGWFNSQECNEDAAPSSEMTIMTVTEQDLRGIREAGWTLDHLSNWYLALFRDYYRLFQLNRRPVYSAGIPEAAVLLLIYETSYMWNWKDITPETLQRAVENLDDRGCKALDDLPAVLPSTWVEQGTMKIEESSNEKPAKSEL